MKIGKFSKMTGLSVLTIRYYIDLGLFAPQRSERYWDFSEEDLSRAAEIARYKNCGFSLQTIAELFSLLQGSNLSQQERMCRLHSVLDCESQRIQTNHRQLTLSLDKLNSMIRDIQGQVVTDSFNRFAAPFAESPCNGRMSVLPITRFFTASDPVPAGFAPP